ncbi:MAG: hypothetical protein E7510_09155 [Ruminococcus sp.]|nr:hypothetical protein [Ruminococcus sp.]
MKTIMHEKMGNVSYRLFSEENKFGDRKITTYGISVKSRDYSEEVHDITTVSEKAIEIYETLIRNAVMPVHTTCVITDLILC